MGTPDFAVPTLELLHSSGHQVRAVFTQPDRPRGRGQHLAAPPVKQAAVRLGLEVHQPEKIRDPAVLDLLESLAPEAIAIVGYGKLIPQDIIDLPRHGCINLHASLLPKYRGAAPVNWALIRGESRTGVTTMKIDAGLDTGPILLSEELEIAPEDDAVSLSRRLAVLGAPLMLETLGRLERGNLTPIPQDHSQATLAPMLKKEDGRIDWSWPAREISNRVRGLVPWPGAYTRFRGALLHLWKARGLTTEDTESTVKEPGTFIAKGHRLLVRCGEGALELLEVQMEGRRRVSAAGFINGARIKTGLRLEA